MFSNRITLHKVIIRTGMHPVIVVRSFTEERTDEQNARDAGGEGCGNVNANIVGMFPRAVCPVTDEIDEISLEEDDTQASSVGTSSSSDSLDSGYDGSNAIMDDRIVE
ncbi:hypothetical protein DICVIV_11758 [Dictyocaulus viviparus]|uniref:Uncharacterized protein n=1 Tax=Dictyocaulus viviparus TaxID=29172 RepID=A0A0D8XEV2_DICVI|nr:hypothetical protein DICVIV_11758 [Dictyocaulus viviparus]